MATVKKTRVLVLGSSGMIGSHLCELVKANGCTVSKMDIKRSVLEDLSDPTLEPNLIRAVERADFVYFLAFDVGGAKFLYRNQHQFDFINNNTKIMSNVFEQLKFFNKPFLFVSSMMATMNGWSVYGRLKQLGEDYTRSCGTGVSMRFWNVYGKEPLGEKSHVIPDFIRQAKEHNQISMMTSGDEVRQFIHVKDACRAMEAVRTAYEAREPVAVDLFNKGEVIDVSNGLWIPIKVVAEAVANQLRPCKVVAGERKDLVQHNMTVEPDLTVIESKPFSWYPTVTLVDGVRMLIDEYKE